MASAFNKFDSFVQELGKGTHNFTTHVLKAAFTNTSPTAVNTVLADITQISTGGNYTGGAGGGLTLDSVTWTNASGTSKLIIADEIFTASTSVGPFRYIVLYNDTPTSPADPLIGYYDYGSALTLANGESFTIDFDATNGVATLA